jgi:DNA-binding MarR family transcriptional regulator
MTSVHIHQLDEVIHGRLRLGIMSYLVHNTGVAEFTELKDVLETTQGNLSVHLRKLEDARYVAIEKSFLRRKPLTRVRLTAAGRKAFVAYLDTLSRLVAEPTGVKLAPARSRALK